MIKTKENRQRSLLFLAPVLLSSYSQPLRGVQIFDFILIRQLVEMGIHVTVPVEITWKGRLKEHFKDAAPHFLYTPRLFKCQWDGLWALMRLRRKRFDSILVANNSVGMIPVIAMAQWMQLASRLIVLAHRAPRQNFIRAVRRKPLPIVAVSQSVAQSFPEEIHSHIQVYYGIPNAANFYPKKHLSLHQTIHFCVLGNLDCSWKGADEVIRAFRMLPKNLQQHCQLNLVYYVKPPHFPESNIVAYSYFSPGDIPDFLRRMDVMIIPSLDERETFSQSMVQGMLTQLPCIVSNLPVLKEKIDLGGGLSYASVSELANHMQKLAMDTDLREKMGRTARTTALARYVWDTKYFVEHFLFPRHLIEKHSNKSSQIGSGTKLHV